MLSFFVLFLWNWWRFKTSNFVFFRTPVIMRGLLSNSIFQSELKKNIVGHIKDSAAPSPPPSLPSTPEPNTLIFHKQHACIQSKFSYFWSEWKRLLCLFLCLNCSDSTCITCSENEDRRTCRTFRQFLKMSDTFLQTIGQNVRRVQRDENKP